MTDERQHTQLALWLGTCGVSDELARIELRLFNYYTQNVLDAEGDH